MFADGPPGTQLKLAPCSPAADKFSHVASGLIRRVAGAAGAAGAAGDLCVAVGAGAPGPSPTNVWARKLAGGKVALVFLNVGSATAPNVTCGAGCIEQTGLAGKAVTIRDLWLHKDIGATSSLTQLVAKGLAPEGGHQMLLLTPQ